ncbi:hypothetical protein BKA61DRAFT_700793 [Leptodontidium sp. MPI-SDFR-AT-0119]|nr:hypothetical protein BKA61DRAFT_700793 [Leptodontidium sp. MPI-SDFR-AT-0119]
MHVNPSSQAVGDILREEETRYDDENIIERLPKEGSKFHVAGWVSWYAKCDKSEFYNDEEDEIEQPLMPPKPRRRLKTETEAEYHQRVLDWEAQKPHQVEKRVAGNHITQKYYTERLLLVYIDAVQKLRYTYGGSWYLQEDEDPSHGMRKEGLARQLKELNWIENLKHPVQPPDLNPIEACWNIVKNRLRRRILYGDEDMRAAIQEEWDKVTMQEIRARISNMPGRCERLTKNGGKAIKTALW